MALNKGGSDGAIFLALKAKTSETDPMPYIGKKTKNPDGNFEISDTYQSIEGVIESVKLKQYEWPKGSGTMVDTFEIKMRDIDEVYILEGNLSTSLSKNIFNSLLGSADRLKEKVKISVGLAKPNDNGVRYAQSWVNFTSGDTKSQWKYQPGDFPKVVKNKKSVIIDDEEYLEFMRKMANEVAGYLKAPVEKNAVDYVHVTQVEGDLAPAPTDDLPF